MGRQIEECKRLIQLLKDLVKEIGEDSLTKKIEILCGIKAFTSPVVALVKEEETAELEAYALGHKNQIIGLIWVLCLQRGDIPQTLKPLEGEYFDFYEPLGKRINAELELWKACLSFIKKIQSPELTVVFNTPIDGWFATTQERMFRGIPNNTKENQILLLREEIQQLKNGINPHDPNKGDWNLFNFINLAIAIKTSQKSDNNRLKRKRKVFRDESWAEYIQAHKDWCRHYSTSKEIKAVFIEDDLLKYYSNGRQKRRVNPPLKEGSLFRKKIKSLNIGSV